MSLLDELRTCLRQDDTLAIEKLLNEHPNFDINCVDNFLGQADDKGTLLVTAILRGKYAMTKLLLKLGADPNLGTFVTDSLSDIQQSKKFTALGAAIAMRHLDITKLLIENKADLFLRKPGIAIPAIFIATAYNHELTSFCIDITPKHEQKFIAQALIHALIEKKDIDNLKKILAFSKPFKQIDKDKTIAITHAAAKDNPEILALLLEAGADPEQADGNGRTAIFIAVKKRRLKNLELLLCDKCPSKLKKEGLILLKTAFLRDFKAGFKLILDVYCRAHLGTPNLTSVTNLILESTMRTYQNKSLSQSSREFQKTTHELISLLIPYSNFGAELKKNFFDLAVQAIHLENTETLNFLIEQNLPADCFETVGVKDLTSGRASVIHSAVITAEEGQIALYLDILIEMGLNINHVAGNNGNALNLACYFLQMDAVFHLLERNIQVLPQTNSQYDPLICVARKEYPEILRILLMQTTTIYQKKDYFEALTYSCGLFSHTQTSAILEYILPIPGPYPALFIEHLHFLFRQLVKTDRKNDYLEFNHLENPLDGTTQPPENTYNFTFQVHILSLEIILMSYLEKDFFDIDTLLYLCLKMADNYQKFEEFSHQKHQEARLKDFILRLNNFELAYERLQRDLSLDQKLSLLDDQITALHKLLQKSNRNIIDLLASQNNKDAKKKQFISNQEKNDKINTESVQALNQCNQIVTDVDALLSLLEKRYYGVERKFDDLDKLHAPRYIDSLLRLLEEPLGLIQNHILSIDSVIKRVEQWTTLLVNQITSEEKFLKYTTLSPYNGPVASPLTDELEVRWSALLLDFEDKLTELTRRREETLIKQSDWQAARLKHKEEKSKCPPQDVQAAKKSVARILYQQAPKPPAPFTLERATLLGAQLSILEERTHLEAVLNHSFALDRFSRRLAQNALLGSLARLLEQTKRQNCSALEPNFSRQLRNAIYHSDWSELLEQAQITAIRHLACRLLTASKGLKNESRSALDAYSDVELMQAEIGELQAEPCRKQLASAWDDWQLMQASEIQYNPLVWASARGFVLARISTLAHQARMRFPKIWAHYVSEHDTLHRLISTGNQWRHGLSIIA